MKHCNLYNITNLRPFTCMSDYTYTPSSTHTHKQPSHTYTNTHTHTLTYLHIHMHTHSPIHPQYTHLHTHINLFHILSYGSLLQTSCHLINTSLESGKIRSETEAQMVASDPITTKSVPLNPNISCTIKIV